ncbi:uncharacterized protein METZ01_LOCUS320925, partial [marine metagenome]
MSRLNISMGVFATGVKASICRSLLLAFTNIEAQCIMSPQFKVEPILGLTKV